MLTFKQNRAPKQEVGHCGLILLKFFFFFHFDYSENQGIQNFSQIYRVVQEEKLFLV